MSVVSDSYFSKEGMKDCIAYWEVENGGGRIVLRKSRNFGERWGDFSHEMAHCTTDYAHWLGQSIIEPFLVDVGAQLEDMDE